MKPLDRDGIKKIYSSSEVPVIIGTGLAGLTISKKLTLEKIPHILLGEKRVVNRPIIGESVEMFGCVILNDLFKKFEQHFYPKLAINYHLQDSICHFDFLRCFKIPDIIQFMEKTNYLYKAEGTYSLIHIDRALFDIELFADVIKSPFCRHMEHMVSDISYDKDQDEIIKIVLDNNESIKPSYVFDCSNTARVVGKALGLQMVELTELMQLVFTHYKVNDKTKDIVQSKKLPWQFCTNIFRYYKERAGFDGTSWCIPIGDYISVGTNITTPLEIDENDVLQITQKNYKERGIDYASIYTEPTQVISGKSKLYYYPKIFGSNWVLAAGAGSLTWYTGQTGVESSMFITNIADRILNYPLVYGQYYQDFVMRQVETHKVHDWLHFHQYGSINKRNSHEYMVNSIRNIQGRYLLGNLALDHSLDKKYEWLENVKKYKEKLTDDEMTQVIEMIARGETCADYLYV